MHQLRLDLFVEALDLPALRQAPPLMEVEHFFAMILSATLDGDTLRIRLDRDTGVPLDVPVRVLEMKNARGADIERLAALKGERLFEVLGGEGVLEIWDDETQGSEQKITYEELTSSDDAYTHDELQLKLANVRASLVAQLDYYSKESTHDSRVRDALRREVLKALDHAREKAAFFSREPNNNPLKSEHFSGEAHAYRRVLELMERLEDIDK